MRKFTRLFLLTGLAAFVVSGCSTSQRVVGTSSGLEDIRALQTSSAESNTTPTVEQYHFARQQFVTSMFEIQGEQTLIANAPAKKIKTAISTGGVILGLGGTIASLVVDNTDTKSTIAQSSGAIAGVAGIVSLLPIGSGADKAKIVSTFLASEMPFFEAKWPSEMVRPLTVAEWAVFVKDAEHIGSIAEELGN